MIENKIWFDKSLFEKPNRNKQFYEYIKNIFKSFGFKNLPGNTEIELKLSTFSGNRWCFEYVSWCSGLLFLVLYFFKTQLKYFWLLTFWFISAIFITNGIFLYFICILYFMLFMTQVFEFIHKGKIKYKSIIKCKIGDLLQNKRLLKKLKTKNYQIIAGNKLYENGILNTKIEELDQNYLYAFIESDYKKLDYVSGIIRKHSMNYKVMKTLAGSHFGFIGYSRYNKEMMKLEVYTGKIAASLKSYLEKNPNSKLFYIKLPFKLTSVAVDNLFSGYMQSFHSPSDIFNLNKWGTYHAIDAYSYISKGKIHDNIFNFIIKIEKILAKKFTNTGDIQYRKTICSFEGMEKLRELVLNNDPISNNRYYTNEKHLPDDLVEKVINLLSICKHPSIFDTMWILTECFGVNKDFGLDFKCISINSL